MCDGTVYVRALNRHELYSIDASTGELNWKYAPGISEGRRLDPVTVEGDTVLVKQNAIIVSISVKTGEINCTYDAGDFPDFPGQSRFDDTWLLPSLMTNL